MVIFWKIVYERVENVAINFWPTYRHQGAHTIKRFWLDGRCRSCFPLTDFSNRKRTKIKRTRQAWHVWMCSSHMCGMPLLSGNGNRRIFCVAFFHTRQFVNKIVAWMPLSAKSLIYSLGNAADEERAGIMIRRLNYLFTVDNWWDWGV